MNWDTLAHNAPWRTPAEQEAARPFTDGMRTLLERSNVTRTPFLAIRLQYVLDNYRLTLRLEGLFQKSQDIIENTPSKACSPRGTPALTWPDPCRWPPPPRPHGLPPRACISGRESHVPRKHS